MVAVIANRPSNAYPEVSRSIEQQRRRLTSNDGQLLMQCLRNCLSASQILVQELALGSGLSALLAATRTHRLLLSMLPAAVVKGMLKQAKQAKAIQGAWHSINLTLSSSGQSIVSCTSLHAHFTLRAANYKLPLNWNVRLLANGRNGCMRRWPIALGDMPSVLPVLVGQRHLDLLV